MTVDVVGVSVATVLPAFQRSTKNPAAKFETACGTVTAIDFLDPASAVWPARVALPSGGDTSYPGLVEHEGSLWMSYYASEGGRSTVRFAKVAIPAP